MRLFLVAFSVVAAAWVLVPVAQPAKSAACRVETVSAVIDGKKTCLQAGQRCNRGLDRQYHRYRFHCHAGSLTRFTPKTLPPRDVSLEFTGPPEVVFDWTNDRCDFLDIPDLPARAFRDADGNVQLISTHYVNRRFVGPDLGRLEHECDVIMGSGWNPDPAAFDDHEWLSSTYTADGKTIYGLIHSEYQGWVHPGQCSTNDVGRCWWNTITFAVSRDRGRSYVQATPPRLVASVPYRYVPDSGTFGAMMPTNIVRNERDGYYYALIYVKMQPAAAADANRNCLIRTRNLTDPRSWRAWSGGKRFDTTFIDPYRSAANPERHLCRGVSPRALGEFVPGSLTYNAVARQWLLVGVAAGGFYYTLSPDLISWTPKRLLWPAEMGWTYQCGDADPVHYASLIDPSSTSRNFQTSDGLAYIYYTQFHTDNCQQGLDRDLVRVRVAVRP